VLRGDTWDGNTSSWPQVLVHPVCIFLPLSTGGRIHLLCCWRQQIYMKRRYSSIKLCDGTILKIAVCIISALRTSYRTWTNCAIILPHLSCFTDNFRKNKWKEARSVWNKHFLSNSFSSRSFSLSAVFLLFFLYWLIRCYNDCRLPFSPFCW